MDGFFSDWGFSNIEKSRLFWSGIGFWMAMLLLKLTEDKNEKAVMIGCGLLSMILAVQVVK